MASNLRDRLRLFLYHFILSLSYLSFFVRSVRMEREREVRRRDGGDSAGAKLRIEMEYFYSGLRCKYTVKSRPYISSESVKAAGLPEVSDGVGTTVNVWQWVSILSFILCVFTYYFLVAMYKRNSIRYDSIL